MDTPKTTPKDFFLYFGAMITLYWSAGSLIALFFRIIDTVFKDQLNYYFDPYSSGIRFAIASLIVVFPISLLLFRTLKKEVIRNTEKLLLPLRRWLYALTVFITSAALIGDLIALLNSFLGGEITTRFVLKVLAVLVVAGLVFWYCLLELRVKQGEPVRIRREFLWGTPLLVLGAILYGFVVMGSPSTQRSLRFDERRVSDLQTIQWQVVNYWQSKNRIPETLAELEDPISGFRAPVDPRTGEPYEYSAQVKGDPVFTVCAVFERPSTGTSIAKPYYPEARGMESWEHGAGRTCFERTIDPELYPVRPKGV